MRSLPGVAGGGLFPTFVPSMFHVMACAVRYLDRHGEASGCVIVWYRVVPVFLWCESNEGNGPGGPLANLPFMLLPPCCHAEERWYAAHHRHVGARRLLACMHLLSFVVQIVT